MNNNGNSSVEKICDGVHYRFRDSFDRGSVQSTKITEWHLLCVILPHCDRILTVLLRYLQKHCGFLFVFSHLNILGLNI
jgi:hypothetical protein